MRLILVRHGETEANAAEITEGHLPGKLSARGREQARRVAKRLSTIPIVLILVSDLARTRETAEPIITAHPKTEVRYEPRLRERSFGEFEGSPYGAVWKRAEQASPDKLLFRPEGGESVYDFRERVKTYLSELIEAEKGKTVLLVTHGGVVAQALITLMRIPEEEFNENYYKYHPDNTAVTAIDISDDGLHKVLHINSTEHLQD